MENRELLRNLRKAVLRAHRKQPNVLGIILFGSRSRGEERPDSDVDLMYVFGDYKNYSSSKWALFDKIKSVVGSEGLRVHHFDSTAKAWLERARNDEGERYILRKSFRYLDRDSKYIGVDNEIEGLLEEVLELSKLEPCKTIGL